MKAIGAFFLTFIVGIIVVSMLTPDNRTEAQKAADAEQSARRAAQFRVEWQEAQQYRRMMDKAYEAEYRRNR